VGRKNPHVEKASYQHPAGYDRSAVRYIVYLFRRPDDKGHATKNSTWTTVSRERRLGDAKTFIRAADGRTRELWKDARERDKNLSKNKAPWCTSFVNVVLSPANRERLSDEDFKQLADPWTKDSEGRELPHVGAVHREGGGRAHLHLAVVRDKFSREELRILKQQTDGLAMGFELELEHEREPAFEREDVSYGLEH
jgi:hypothetical protein